VVVVAVKKPEAPRTSLQGLRRLARALAGAGVLVVVLVHRSLKMNRNFTNATTKVGLLEKKGDAKAALELRQKALATATEAELNTHGYQLLGQGKLDEAIQVFERNARDHPDSWNAHDSLAEALVTKGDKKRAIAGYEKAISLTDDESQQERINKELAKLR
jgi:tetratricopeptide (TPR) repeat protein